MHSNDWQKQAYERFQSATRTIRLTLPPGKGVEFWEGVLDRIRMKRRGLAITILIDPNPRNLDALKSVVRILPELEASGHEVSWVAARGFDFFLMIADEISMLLVAGDPSTDDCSHFVHQVENTDQTISLRNAFDRRVSEGIWGISPEAWLSWIKNVRKSVQTRSPLISIEKSEARLEKRVTKALKKLPTRSCWLFKPRDSAYGVPEPPGGHRWGEYVSHEMIGVGWPKLCDTFSFKQMPSRDLFEQELKRSYSMVKSVNRSYSILRNFLSNILPGDRVIAIEGWTGKQSVPVRFHGWTRVNSDPQIIDNEKGWRLSRKAHWQRYELDLPIDAVRETTGLQASTYPIHRVNDGVFRRLVALAEEVRVNQEGDNQLMLDLTVVNSTPVPLGLFDD